MSPTIEATLIQAIQVAVSVCGAFVLFYFLKSTAIIRRKGLQLGGAGAMFVVIMFILNKYLPDIHRQIITDAAASQPVSIAQVNNVNKVYKVSISPAAQTVSKREIDNLDRNQFFVDDILEIGIKRATDSNWEIKVFDVIDDIGVFDIPGLYTGKDMMGGMLFGDNTKQKIFGMRRTIGRKLVIDKESSINGMRFSTNLLDNDEFIRRVTMLQIQQMKKMKMIDEDVDFNSEKFQQVMKQIGGMLREKSKESIDLAFPIKREIHSGVYVTIMPKEVLMSEIVPVHNSMLDKAWTRFILSGAVPTEFDNLYINQDSAVASFRSNVHVDDALIDGKKADITISHVDFIVAGSTRAICVDLLYISTDGIGVFEELQEILDSLRFTG